MPATTHQWVNASLRRTSHAWLELSIAVLALLLSSLAISNRAYWCQLQAYTVLGLFGVTLLLYVRQYTRRLHESVAVRNNVYCVDCKRESRMTVFMGARLHRQPSVYEALNPRPIDAWLIVFVWAVWVCYGALFHDGKHVHDENELLHEATGGMFGDNLPGLLRDARVVALYFVSLESFFSGQARLGGIGALLFLALFPDSTSTPQSLDTPALIVRSLVFVSLFVASEVIERLRPYAAYIAAYDRFNSATVVVYQMALRKALRRSISSSMTAYLCASGLASTDQHSATAEERADYETRRAAERVLVRLSSPLRSAWVLIVSPMAYAFALVQIAMSLAIVWYNWKRVRGNVGAKSEVARLIHAEPSGQSHKRRARSPILPVTKKDLPRRSSGSAAKSQPFKKSRSPPPSVPATPPPSPAVSRASSSARRRPKKPLPATTTKRRAPRPATPKARQSPEVSEDAPVAKSDSELERPPTIDGALTEAMAIALRQGAKYASPKDPKHQD